MTNALFTVDLDSSNQGFDAAISATLALQLKTLPAAGINTVVFQVFDPAGFSVDLTPDKNPPRQSKGAPDLTLDNGVTTGSSVSPVAVGGIVNVDMPGTAGHGWLIRCTVNDGVKQVPGRGSVPDPQLIHERMIVIRDAAGLRPIIATEVTQYEDDGWAGAVSESIAASGGGGGDLALGGNEVAENFIGGQQQDTGNPGLDPGTLEFPGIGSTNWTVVFVDCDHVDSGWRPRSVASEPGQMGGGRIGGGDAGSIAYLVHRPFTSGAGSGLKPFQIEHIQEITFLCKPTSASASGNKRIFCGFCDFWDEENRGGDWFGLERDLTDNANWQLSFSDTPVTLVDTGVSADNINPTALRIRQQIDSGGTELGNGLWDIYVNNLDTPVLTSRSDGLARNKRVDIGFQVARLLSGGVISQADVFFAGYKLFPMTLAYRLST